MGNSGWIAVDLDGTLAFYDHWRGPEHIGAPIPLMVDRVKRWLEEGRDVRIFTARVDGGQAAIDAGDEGGLVMKDIAKVEMHIQEWCRAHLGRVLPITCKKDYGMVELWDDRCVQVIPNTGRTIADELESERSALAGKAAVPT